MYLWPEPRVPAGERQTRMATKTKKSSAKRPTAKKRALPKKTSKKQSPEKRTPKRKSTRRQATYFLSLSVKNLRCFGAEEQTLDLTNENGGPAHWTVILGNNATGKTTLLTCLSLFEREARKGSEILSSFVSLKRRSQRLELVADFMACTGLGARSSLSGKTDRQRIWTELRGENEQIATYSSLGPHKLQSPTCECYGVSRRMGSTTLGGNLNESRWTNTFYEEAELINAEEWLLQLDYAALKRGKAAAGSRNQFAFVRDLLINLLPDVQDIRVGSPARSVRPTVEFKTTDGWVPLDWLGHGYKTLLSWMVDLAARMVQRYPRSKDPLSEPAIVLVDEIDLHMHPRWQRQIMGFLSERFPNTQFIVTAHSPLFVQAAKDANLVVLERDEKKGHVVIRNDVQAIAGWRVDQILTSDLFGMDSARPPETQELLEQRRELLTKSKLTKTDERKLEKLEERIGTLPVGESPEAIKIQETLGETLKYLKKRGGKKGAVK